MASQIRTKHLGGPEPIESALAPLKVCLLQLDTLGLACLEECAQFSLCALAGLIDLVTALRLLLCVFRELLLWTC